MRVVEVTRGLGQGGAEQLLLARLTLDRGDVDTTVLNTLPTMSRLTDAFIDAGIRLATMSGGLVRSNIGAIRACRRLAPDVVIVHSPWPAAFLKAARGLRLLPMPVIEVVHANRYRPAVMLASRLTNRSADAAVAVSVAVSESVVSRGYRRQEVIYAGIDSRAILDFVQDGAEEIARIRRAAVRPGPGRRMLVCVAGLRPVKGHEDLIRAVALGRNDFDVVLVGEGPERDRIEASIELAGLGDRVRLVGHQADAWRWIAAADVMCLASHNEGLPLVLMEAVTSGTPIVATSVGGIPEIVRPGVNGSLVPSQDVPALARAIDEWWDRLATGSAGRLAPDTGWDENGAADSFYAFVKDVLSRPDTGAAATTA